MDETDEQNIATDAKPIATYTEPGMEEVILRRPGWAFLLWWVVANTIGATMGWFLARAIADRLLRTSSIYNYDIVSHGILMGLLLGSAIGLVEWLVLRAYISDVGWWVPATTIGWSAALMISAYAEPGYAGYENPVLLGLMMGTATSLVQYIGLRRRIALVELWVVVNVLAWIVTLTTVPQVYDFTDSLRSNILDFIRSINLRLGADLGFWIHEWPIVMPLLWVFVVMAITTGLTLICLLRRPVSATQASTDSVISA